MGKTGDKSARLDWLILAPSKEARDEVSRLTT
jgi:hypothetical protein